MASKKKRYLLIGLFFLVIAVVAALSVFQGGSGTKNLVYAGICGLIAFIFLKNAILDR
jgi:uncharacterized membrane protein